MLPCCLQPPWADDPLLQPLLERTPRMHGPSPPIPCAPHQPYGSKGMGSSSSDGSSAAAAAKSPLEGPPTVQGRCAGNGPRLEAGPELGPEASKRGAGSSIGTSAAATATMPHTPRPSQGWGAMLVLDTLAVARILTHHPCSQLREAVYLLGLQGRMDMLLPLRGRLAAAR